MWLQPTTVQNVVMYTVVVDAKNDRGLLYPGMTATTDFLVDDGPRTILDYLPSSGALARSSHAIKEHLGLLWYRVNGWAE